MRARGIMLAATVLGVGVLVAGCTGVGDTAQSELEECCTASPGGEHNSYSYDGETGACTLGSDPQSPGAEDGETIKCDGDPFYSKSCKCTVGTSGFTWCTKVQRGNNPQTGAVLNCVLPECEIGTCPADSQGGTDGLYACASPVGGGGVI